MELFFQIGSDATIIKIEGKNVLFSNSALNFNQFVPIERIRFTEQGILKEHPDLKGMKLNDMRDEAIRRWKRKIQAMESEDTIRDYIINEMERMGYEYEMIKRNGFRPVRIK